MCGAVCLPLRSLPAFAGETKSVKEPTPVSETKMMIYMPGCQFGYDAHSGPCNIGISVLQEFLDAQAKIAAFEKEQVRCQFSLSRLLEQEHVCLPQCLTPFRVLMVLFCVHSTRRRRNG